MPKHFVILGFQPYTTDGGMNQERLIFKHGSKTYFFSSQFFPEPVRSDIYKLYSFVRTADNYVDNLPAQPHKIALLRRYWRESRRHPALPPNIGTTDRRVAHNMAYVAYTYHLESAWIEDFLDTMYSDSAPRRNATLADTLRYTYGSAEVIGLMMARLLDLPRHLDEAATLQGRAMQYINFIRDIAEDTRLGRCYFPAEDLQHFNLPDLTKSTARQNREAFTRFIRFQIARYQEWQTEAAKGYAAIPRRYRIPIQTAADMYNWTARQIAKDPFIVFERKVKPHTIRIIRQALWRSAWSR